MKKILSTFLLFFLLFTSINTTFGYGSFTQTSDPQYSESVNDSDIITSTNWNAVVYDISNLITDIGGLKDYIDANLVNFFRDDGATLSYSDKNVSIAKNLEIGGKTTTSQLNILAGALPTGVITTDDILNGSLLQEDLDPNIDYGQDVVFQKNANDLYYDGGNIAIGDIIADEKVSINNGSLKIMGDGNGIIFPDGTKLTTLPTLSNDDVLTINDQTIEGNKQFADGINLATSHVGNIFKNSIDQAVGNTNKSTSGYIEDNESIAYFVEGTGTSYATFDSNVIKSGKFTLKEHINPGEFIKVRVNAIADTGNTNELPKLLPNTTYKAGIFIRADLTGSDYGAYTKIITSDASGATTASELLTPLVNTSRDWSYYETTFTTSSDTVSGHIEFSLIGNLQAKSLNGDVWFDVNSFSLIPLINENANIIKVSNVLDSNKSQPTDEKTVVTEKAISDYIATKGTKIAGVCGYSTDENFRDIPSVGLCNIGEPSEVTPGTDYDYSWTCSGIDGGAEVNCATKKCIPNIVQVPLPDPTSCREILERDNSSPSGMYDIFPDGTQINVYCDMDTDGGGWTRYLNVKSKYTTSDAKNCWLGTNINNSTMECFNPNRYDMTPTSLMLKINGNTYSYDLPDNTVSYNTKITKSGSNRQCVGQSYYMVVMNNDGNTALDGSDAKYTRLGLSYCRYDREVGGLNLTSGNEFQNYSKSGHLGPAPGARESTPKAQEIFIRDRAPILNNEPNSSYDENYCSSRGVNPILT